MKEMDSLEQEMRQWRPRQPAERLARRLFRRAELAPGTLRRTEFWNWLTPVAACALTVLVAVGSASYRDKVDVGEGGGMVFAGWILDPGASNVPQRVRLSQMDENVQWNVCPKLAPPAGTQIGESSATAGARRAAATNLNRNF
jgi:hypothetical protein